MNKIKLARFDNPKWTYKQLCKYALKYKKMLYDKATLHRQRDEFREARLAGEVYDHFYRYNSIPRDTLIGVLKEAQKLLYK